MRGWSPEEDELLLNLIETSGKRWKFIAEQLGNANPRTPAMVRNRFLRIERGRFLTEQGLSKNRCGQCGELKRGHVCRAPRSVVSTSLTAQEIRHHEVRRQAADERRLGMTPDNSTKASATTTPTKSVPASLGGNALLNLGNAAPLTFVSTAASDDTMSIGTPDLLALGLSPGGPRSGMSLGLPTLSGTGAAPPGLRPQSSFDMLLKASEMRQAEPTEMTSRHVPVHPSSTMKILADTPNCVGDYQNPFGSGFGGAAVPGTPAIPSPGDLARLPGSGMAASSLCSRAERAMQQQEQQQQQQTLVEATSA